MDSRTLQSLEFHKVLAGLSGFAVSEGGKKAALLLRPLPDLPAIHEAADLYAQGRTWLEATGAKARPFPELDGLFSHLEGSSPYLDLDALWALRQVLSTLREFTESLMQDKQAGQWPLWAQRCEGLNLPVNSISALNRCIADDGHIRDEASPELYLVRSELRRLHQQCTRQVKDFAKEYNILHYLQDEFMTLSSDRYVLPLKSNFKGRLQGIIHDYSQTGETCYFEPLFLVEVNNRLQDLKREEREEERKILAYLTGLVRQELPGVKAGYALLLELDLLCAKKSLADCYDGRIPEFDVDRLPDLKDAVHPLLALAFAGKDKGKSAPVASDLSLKAGQQALIISGGNAGGKTVCLKTLGLVALMGMAGLPAPVGPGSSLPYWPRVHAFIGDEQSLDDHVSTFTAQITHLARIWPELSSGSLVILDEFGAGTDPSQGAALAQAVVDNIMDKGAHVAAATHFPALKAYALSNERVRAASVLFDPKTKKPLFKLIYDQVGASQALDVAREHGLPDEVLRRAEQYLLISGEDTSALVERLNALAVEREEELTALKKEQARIDGEAKKSKEKFEKERTRLFDSVQAEAKKILQEWKGARLSSKQALKDLAKVRQELAAAGPEAVAPENRGPGLLVADLEEGQMVRHVPWNRTGRVLEKDERKKRVRLDLSGVSLWAAEADLAAAPEGAGGGVQAGRGYTSASGAGAGSPLPLRLDLRGMRADVAISEVAKFLDSAVLSGRDEVEIIHGRGTGALRKEVHNFLKISPSASAFRLGNEKEGGDGVTIVTLQ